MRSASVGLIGAALVACGYLAWGDPAWGEPPRQATDEATHVTAAELDAVFATIGNSIDKQVKVVDVGAETNVAVGILNRAAMSTGAGPVRMIVHHDVTEVYYVVSGSGSLATGGVMADGRDFAADSGVVTELVGPSASGTVAGPSSDRPVGPGDVVIIPAGVPHGFRQIDEAITYLSFRVDPGQVLPAGYINPVIR